MAITLVASGEHAGNLDQTQTFSSFAAGNDAELLLVFVGWWASGTQSANAAKWGGSGGDAMTLEASKTDADSMDYCLYSLDISADNGTQDIWVDISETADTAVVIHASSWKGVDTGDMVGNVSQDFDAGGSDVEIGAALTGGASGDVIYMAGAAYTSPADVGDRNGQTEIAETSSGNCYVGSGYKSWGGVEGNDWAFYGGYCAGAGLVINAAGAATGGSLVSFLASMGVGA